MNKPTQEFKILANLQLDDNSSGGREHALEPMIIQALSEGWRLHGPLMRDVGYMQGYAQAVVRDIVKQTMDDDHL